MYKWANFSKENLMLIGRKWADFVNLSTMNYLEAITIRMKPTLMKERRFDDNYVDQGWNVCSPCSYIIKKMYFKFVIHVVYLIALIRCFLS